MFLLLHLTASCSPRYTRDSAPHGGCQSAGWDCRRRGNGASRVHKPKHSERGVSPPKPSGIGPPTPKRLVTVRRETRYCSLRPTLAARFYSTASRHKTQRGNKDRAAGSGGDELPPNIGIGSKNCGDKTLEGGATPQGIGENSLFHNRRPPPLPAVLSIP